MIGGSFNPVHMGHLALADEVRVALGYDRILLIPASTPPHKELVGDATADDRLAMLESAAEGAPWLTVDPCEIRRGGVSWTIETLEYLGHAYPDMEGLPGLVIGADLIPGFSRWKRAEEIARVADVILARRPPDFPARTDTATVAEDSFDAFPYRHGTLENPPLAISSSGVRARIREGKSWRYLVPESVYRYIIGHGLYDSRTT